MLTFADGWGNKEQKKYCTHHQKFLYVMGLSSEKQACSYFDNKNSKSTICTLVVCFAMDMTMIFFQASDQKDCSPCRENVNRLFVQFKTEYEFGISHFNENVCPQMSDSDNCVTKNTEWWPYLSQIIYSDQAPKYVCQALDPDCTFE